MNPISSRILSWAVALLASIAFDQPLPAAAPVAKPNIVLLFIDDMGYGDIGPFGSTKNRTPNLDRMAREGMKLTSFYAAPVCSVSRAQVNTGCYGVRVSIPGVFGPASRYGINAAEHTVAELLKAQGYATMCIGKWHLGDQPVFFPTRHGFDHYFGLPYSNDMGRKAAKTGQEVVPLVRDEQVIELLAGPDQDRIVERYTDEAVKFIHDNKSRPFFLYLPHTAVHVPVHPGKNFQGKSQNGRFGDWVEEVDWSCGRVLATLRELKLAENTLVMFSSDNGPWLPKGADAGTAGPLRGGKGSTWEGGVREPTIAWWPGRIAPGTVCDAIAGNIDFLPTFVKVAGGTVPIDRKIDGRDISPLLFGQTKASPHEARYYYRGYKLEAVRVGPWKLALGPQSENTGKPSSPDAMAPGLRLYNLDAEIGERTDVAAQHPDVVKRLQALATRMAAELGDGKPGPAVRPAGEVENPVLLFPGADAVKAKKEKKVRKNKAAQSTAAPE
jgi:arylsulfatase A